MKNLAFLNKQLTKRNAKTKKGLRGLFVLLLALTGCGQPAQQTSNQDLDKTYSSQQGGTLIDAITAEPSGLICMINGEGPCFTLSGNIFNRLLKYNKTLDLEGELATSWQVSADQKTITFKLKPDLKWADGKPLTSADVLWSWQAITDEKNGSPYASDYQLVKKAEVPDALTFSVTYSEPYAPALDSWAGLQVLPKHLLEGQDLHTTAFARKPIGSSYYQLDSWTTGQNIQLSRNPSSVLGAVNIDKLVSRIIPDTSAQFLELMAGNIDNMGLDPTQFSRIVPARPRLIEKLNLYKELGSGYTYMGFNLKRKPFDDVRVRQAINYAIDKQEIIDGVYLGLGINIASPYKPGTRWSNPNLQNYAYDPAKAKALLKEAGFVANSNGILERDGKPLIFEVLIANGKKDRERTATLIQRRLKAIGIKMTIRSIEWASLISRFIKKSDFDVIIMAWGLGLDPDQYSIWHSSQQGGDKFNFIGYNNPAVDKLLIQGRRELDPDKRQKIYHEFAKVLLDDSPIVYLSAGYGLSAIHKRVKGIANPIPPAGVGFESEKWFIPEPLRRTEMNE
jgi:peptide/nickel transport system substrate-binding protein